MLLILAARQRRSGGIKPAVIAGEGGSPAGSLDGAISKNARWLSEIFGTDSGGTPLILRMVARGNPERKRPGPVSITIPSAIQRDLKIKVMLDGCEISEESGLSNLACALGAELHDIGGDHGRNGAKPKAVFDLEKFRNFFFDDLSASLCAVNIFDREQNACRYQALLALAGIRRTERLALTNIDRDLGSAGSVGLGEAPEDFEECWRKVNRSEKMRIAVPGSHASALLLLRDAVKQFNLPIEVVSAYSHANEVASEVLKNDPNSQIDACVLSLGQVIQLLHFKAKETFSPLMFLPPVTVEVLLPAEVKNAGSKLPRNGFLLCEGETSSRLFLKQLIESRGDSLTNHNLIHAEPSSFAFHLNPDADDRFIVAWFPYNVILSDLSGAQRQYVEQFSHKDNLLVVSPRLHDHKKLLRSLDIILRRTWLELVESDERKYSAIDDLIGDTSYIAALRRWINWDFYPARKAANG